MKHEPSREPWSSLVDDYEAMFVGFSSAVAVAAVRELCLEPGERLLDVAAGTGALTVQALHSGARVTAIDSAPGMLSRLETKLSAEQDVDARLMDGTALDFDDGVFDCAASNLGVVNFDEPARGLVEMRRVVREGGRVAVTTVARPDESLLMLTIFRALAAAGVSPPAEQPSFAALSDRDALRSALNAAGLNEVRVVTSTIPWVVEDAAEFWRRWAIVAPPVAALFDAIPQERLSVAGDAFVRLVEDIHRDGRAVFPTEIHIALGER